MRKNPNIIMRIYHLYTGLSKEKVDYQGRILTTYTSLQNPLSPL